MASAAAPSSEAVAQHGLDTSLAALATWSGLNDVALVSIAKHLGFPETVDALKNVSPRCLAASTDEEFQAAINSLEDMSFAVKMCARTMHHAAVAIFRPPEVPSTTSALATLDTGTAKESGASVCRKIKISNLLDPIDETDVPAATKPQLVI